jgi:arginine-tRNA-protein transferase
MLRLERVIEKPRPCAYLPAERASLEVEVLVEVSPEEMQALVERGWRRFGPVYFRAACAACRECVSLRVPVARFEPSRTQRRVARASGRFRRVVGPPRVDDARLELYGRWHATREELRGWEPSEQTRERYEMELAMPHPCAREAAFYDDDAGGKLVGLGLFDAMPGSLSAVYFFHDPTYARHSLGVANVLTLVADARASGREHVYLGYRVEGCASLRYKASYRPHELLVGRPGRAEIPRWETATALTP